jgi:hypothetical protein
LPVRTALRFVTVSGSFNEGGKGAPGVPQPASSANPAKANTSANTPEPLAEMDLENGLLQ